MKFPYKQIGPYLRPITPIEISYKGIEFQYEVLVDSGADYCVFDIGIADTLGIDLSKCESEEISGITGKSEIAYIERIPIILREESLYVVARFMKMGRHGYGVVGQRGFFDRFVVTFDYVKKEIEIMERMPNKEKFKSRR